MTGNEQAGLPGAAECIAYSRNFAHAKPDIGTTERDHILGLCAALERQAAAFAELIDAVEEYREADNEYGACGYGRDAERLLREKCSSAERVDALIRRAQGGEL